MKPTVTGWYWFRDAWTSMRSGAIAHGIPHIVRVQMSYTLRNRVVPHVVGQLSSIRLDKVHEAAEFVGPLECPWKEEGK